MTTSPDRRLSIGLVVALVSMISLGTMSPSLAVPPDAQRAIYVLADYRFANTLTSSEGFGAVPDLVDFGAGTSTFGTEVVNGKPRTVAQVPEENGLDLENASTVFSTDSYTIVVLMRFDDVDGYRRIINFAKDARDTGLYVYNGKLRFYDKAQGTTAVIAADDWVQVVLTRASSGEVKGYVDGVTQFTFMDPTGRAVVSAGDVLRFFRDDGSENSAASVARIRIYDGPLSAAKVAALDELPKPPKVRTNTPSASPGFTITVAVDNFGPAETVKIKLKDPVLGWRTIGSTVVDVRGHGSVDLDVPGDSTPGSAKIKAIGQTSDLGRKRSFTIDPV